MAIVNPNTGKLEESSSWLTVGKEYTVWQVSWDNAQRQIDFRFEHDDNNSPALSHANLFEVTSDFIPSNWSVKSVPNRNFVMGPRAWQVEGFWVAYFDGEPWARELYRLAIDQMLAEEESYLKALT